MCVRVAIDVDLLPFLEVYWHMNLLHLVRLH
jgi:hypothetical protein